MNFVADESCASPVIRALREAGHERNRVEVERRHFQRYPFVAVARVREILSEIESEAHTSDISTEGCFVDTLNPSPVGTAVRVTISHGGSTFTALGNVIFALPNMGMGSHSRRSNPSTKPFSGNGSPTPHSKPS